MLFLLSACSDNLSQLERIQSRGILRVAIIVTPPLYFPNESLIRGFDYDIVSDYADSINSKLKIINANTISGLIELLKQGKAHIGISGSLADIPDQNIQIGPPYNENEWYVIGNRKNSLPDDLSEIAPGKIVVAEGSLPTFVLAKIDKTYSGLHWVELPDMNTRQILAEVNKNNLQLSIINADIFTYYQHLYPEIKIAFKLPEKYPSHWLTYKNNDESILNSISNFIEAYKLSKQPEELNNTYFRHLNTFNYIDSLYYLKRIKTVLPEYQKDFRAASINYDFDERFLAAISYQESHWNNDAKSGTGVRGIMMLTKETASRVNVPDRTDPEQSINGGAKYLNLLKKSLPSGIKEPDRSWMTLAAYNIGLGHLEDARVLTQKAGDDPNHWFDVEKHLPKLSQEEWYTQTKYGYARGYEAVEFVRRIRLYYDILRLYQQEELLSKLDKKINNNRIKINSPTI